MPSRPSHDRLAVLAGAPTDTQPFSELTLDDPAKRLSSGLDIARHVCAMGWRVAFSKLSQQVLHIPAEDLAAMKAHLSAQAAATTAGGGGGSGGGGCGYVSTNDAVVVFVWMLMLKLRREGVRGWRSWFVGRCAATSDQGTSLDGDGGGGGGGFALQTIDMRGLGIQGLDANLFGNASVMVAAHMPPPPRLLASEEVSNGGGGGGSGGGGGGGDDAAAGGVMAAAMRSAVNAFKAKSEAEHRGSILALASASTAIHLKSVITGVALSDAFMSSWLGVVMGSGRSCTWCMRETTHGSSHATGVTLICSPYSENTSVRGVRVRGLTRRPWVMATQTRNMSAERAQGMSYRSGTIGSACVYVVDKAVFQAKVFLGIICSRITKNQESRAERDERVFRRSTKAFSSSASPRI